MNGYQKIRLWCLLCATLLLACGDVLNAQQPPSDVAALVRETNQRSARPESPMFVAWVPPELWTTDATLPEETRTEIQQILSPYLLFVVADGSVGPMGVTYLSELELRESTRVLDRQRARYAPVDYQSLNVDALVLLSMLRPSLERLFEQGGIDVHVLAFPNRDSAGNRIASALEAGGFSVAVGGEELSWTLPLRSLPPK